MTTTVKKHYSEHLGPIYSWMTGDFDAACDQASHYFDEIKLKPLTTRCAIDLGCGHGVQSVPLAKRGFDVLAIDNCDYLLDELRQNAVGLSVDAVNDDMLRFDRHASETVDMIVCMGDTLTHLDSKDCVRRLIATAAQLLVPGGAFCLSYRDYASTELKGTNRFIPVRQDENRIHTCFLEYESTHVIVHDILQSRTDAGWTTTISAYRKVRVAPEEVVDWASEAGLVLSHQVERNGMTCQAFLRR